jgi:thiosulfate sulfurtransferase
MPLISVDQLDGALRRREPFVVLDVRRAVAYAKNPVQIPGALRVLPEDVEAWARQNPQHRGTQLIAYCVYGHEVSQGAAAALEPLGFNASYLEGGLAQWQAQGLDVLSPGA